MRRRYSRWVVLTTTVWHQVGRCTDAEADIAPGDIVLRHAPSGWCWTCCLCAKVDADVLVRARAWCFAESYQRAEAPLARWCDRGRRSQEDPPGRHWAFTEAKVPTRVLVAEAGGLLGCRRRS